MVTERALINALILGGSLIAAPFIISSALESGDFVPFLVFAGLILFLISFFVFRDSLGFAPILCGSMAVSLNFLPIPLDGSHAAAVMLILYFFTGYVIMRQKPIRLGPPRFFWPMMVLFVLLIYNNHTISLGRLGGSVGDTEGIKPAVLLYVMYIAYFCAINVRPPTVEFLSKIPYYTVILTALSTTPFLLSTVVPGIAPYLHLITNKVNVQAYVESVSDNVGNGPEGIGRMAALSGLGMPLQAYLLCRYPIGTWLRPERWWIIPTSFICLALTAATGFRSFIFTYLFQAFVAIWCYYAWRSLLLPVVLAIAVSIVVVASSNNLIPLPLNKLPMIAQRSLSFIPADWDPDAISSGQSSNDFRENIVDVYEKDYIMRSPWIGIGFNVDSKVYNDLLDMSNHPLPGQDIHYIQAKIFIEGEAFHTGWISLYNTFGIIGFAAFLVFAATEIWTLGVFIFDPKADRRSSLFPLYVWMFTMIVTMVASFFTVFGDIASALTLLLLNAIVLSHLIDLRKTREAPSEPSGRKEQAEFNRAGESRYGYSKY